MTEGKVQSYERDDDIREKHLTDLGAFFKAYWTAIQPAWRKESGEWPLSRDSTPASDWQQLRKGGPGGFHLVLKILGCWLETAWYKEERQMVEDAIDDVNFVLAEMLKGAGDGSVLGKRTREARKM